MKRGKRDGVTISPTLFVFGTCLVAESITGPALPRAHRLHFHQPFWRLAMGHSPIFKIFFP